MIKIDIKKSLLGVDGNMELSVDLDIKDGEFIALFGESGSGKTTLLRIIAGLESASGTINVDGKTWLEKNSSLKVQKREIGFVFQDYALFTNMSVEENLLYVNRDKKLAYKLLEMTNLLELKDRYPNRLSGGQQQRVSLCRALMGRPKLLLMDEPLSALDPNMRVRLQHEILKLHKEFKTTTIFVTHDLSEIYKMADRVILLDRGKIIKDGTPKEVLLKSSGTQKFSFEGELLDIQKIDIIYMAIVSIGQQLVEVVISKEEADNLKVGQKVTLSTKAFAPTLSF